MCCITHQLNTSMRNSIENSYQGHAIVNYEVMAVKSIVRIFKQNEMSKKLPIRKCNIQAAKTRFGTFCTVAERFIEPANNMLQIIEE